MKIQPTTVAEINLDAISNNYRVIRKLTDKRSHILAVIKADAYGHGMIKVAKLLNKLGVEYFGVSDLREGIALRKKWIKKPILIFENILTDQAPLVFKHRLTPTVCTFDLAKALNRLATHKGKKLNIHVKVDTGMGRLGVWYKEADSFIKKILNLNFLSIEGLYTHFPVADTDKAFTKRQMSQMYDLVKLLNERGVVIPYIHSSNSMGVAGYKAKIFNLNRPGLMFYGHYPTPSLKNKIKLKPALTVKSKIIFLKKIEKGRSVSYGRTFIAKRNMTIATVPIGYYDGYFRELSNKAFVLVSGIRCSVLGRVTMDQIMIDVTKVKSAKIGSEVVILGRQRKNEISADDLAQWAKTINYEIICSLGNRLPRTYNP